MTAAHRGRRVLQALAAAGLLLGAFFGGMLAERLRFDVQRRDMLRRYDQAVREHQTRIMQSEKRSGDSHPAANPGR